MKPDKIFGLIFFQCDYSKVRQSKEGLDEKGYQAAWCKYKSQQKISNPEWKKMPMSVWTEKELPAIKEKFERENRERILSEIQV